MSMVSRAGLVILLTEFLKIAFGVWDLADIMTVEERLALLAWWIIGALLFISGIGDEWVRKLLGL